MQNTYRHIWTSEQLLSGLAVQETSCGPYCQLGFIPVNEYDAD